MKDLFISTTTFGVNDDSPLKKLQNSGITFELNPYGRKLNSKETSDLAKKSKVVIAGIEDLTDLVKSSTNLKLIARLGVGLENVPFSLCKKNNIRVSFTPDSVTPAISELTIALMLAVCRNISISDKNIKDGLWERKMGTRLGNSVIGIIGFGRVGRKVSELLCAFNPKKILINDLKIDYDSFQKIVSKGCNLEESNLIDILKNSDIISIHVGLNKMTKNLIRKDEFKLMKKNSILINTSRGGIVNENDLYSAIQKKIIRAAGLDVFESEPYNGILKDLDDIILSPHQGSATIDCRAKMEMEVVEDVIRFFKNEPLKQEVIF